MHGYYYTISCHHHQRTMAEFITWIEVQIHIFSQPTEVYASALYILFRILEFFLSIDRQHPFGIHNQSSQQP